MKPPRILICLSLPKTGTSFLESLAQQVGSITLPKIKEPNYFFAHEPTDDSVMNAVLSPGNFERGHGWYQDLYPVRGRRLLDLSTQYWLHHEQVIKKSTEDFEPSFFTIKRNKGDQLRSYIAHLRRGHIEDRPMREIVRLNKKFGNYLHDMAGWNENFSDLKTRHSEFEFLEYEFEDLVNDPTSTLESLLSVSGALCGIDTDVYSNPKGHPRLGWINKALFSGFARHAGRLVPPVMYSQLLRLRKKVVTINLQQGGGKFSEDDNAFVTETFE